MDVAVFAEARRGWSVGFGRVVRGECGGDGDHDRAGGGGAVERVAPAVSEVWLVFGAGALQQLFDDHAVSDPGEFFEVVVGSVGGGVDFCDSDLGGVGIVAEGDEGGARWEATVGAGH